MRHRVLLSLGALCLLAADDPRAVVEKAVKAQGGEQALARKVATYRKLKGTVEVGNTQATVNLCETFSQGDHTKTRFRLEVAGQTIEFVHVTAGDKMWVLLEGRVTDQGEEDVKAAKASSYHDRVLSLVPLLREKEFTLESLPDAEVLNRRVVGVRVSSKDRADTDLYFDPTTHLLVKYAYRARKPGRDKEVLNETVFSNYREAEPAAADEKALNAAGTKTDAESLIAFLKARRDPEKRARAKDLIKQLGDDSFEAREAAQRELTALGPAVLPLLKEAAESGDAEVARRAKECVEKIGDQKLVGADEAAVRMLALSNADGAAPALLDLLPGAESTMAREIKAGLWQIGQRPGKPDATLTKALEDKDPVKRAAAEAALGKDGGAFAKTPGLRVFAPGVKFPMKSVLYEDGKEQAALEVIDVQFYNAFDDQVFARPQAP